MASAIAAAGDYASRRRFRCLIALIVLVLLWWYVLEAIERRAGDVEQLAAGSVLSQLRSAVLIKSAEAMLSQPLGYERRLDGNPFDWLEQEWTNYQGVCEGAYPPHGQWCFQVGVEKNRENHSKGWLIYRPTQPITVTGQAISPGSPGAWRVALEFAEVRGEKRPRKERRTMGLKLVAVDPVTGTSLSQDGGVSNKNAVEQ
ncbi:MAG: hypothetical protein VX339_09050 [Pseudomonadota bacterium]|nr:hypothetical protein [Pseudomonadota bacterium]